MKKEQSALKELLRSFDVSQQYEKLNTNVKELNNQHQLLQQAKNILEGEGLYEILINKMEACKDQTTQLRQQFPIGTCTHRTR